MSAPATLGRGLGRSLAVATVVGMALFGILISIVIYISENGEQCSNGELEDPPEEIAVEIAVALAIAAPFGIALSLWLGKRLTHSTTDRLDDVIASAKRMTGEQLHERLPVGAANDSLDHLSVALNGLLERVEGGVAAQRQFAADASHELRTPLTVISTNLEVARRKPRDAAHWEHVVDDTFAEIRRMEHLIDKLLELSRAGAAGLHHEPTDLRELVTSAVDRIAAVAKIHAVKVGLDPGPVAEASIDPDAIAIVLDNLLRNAVEHSPRDQAVIVKVGPGPRVIVEDRGPGIPVDQRSRVFEPFARGLHRTDRATGAGLGLGLAICKRIVDGHLGTIEVGEVAGGGARFTITFPSGA